MSTKAKPKQHNQATQVAISLAAAFVIETSFFFCGKDDEKPLRVRLKQDVDVVLEGTTVLPLLPPSLSSSVITASGGGEDDS